MPFSALDSYHRSKLIPIAESQLDRLLPGELADTLGRLGHNFVQVIQQQIEGELTLSMLTKMIRVCPLNHRAVEIIALRGTPRIGEYMNGDDSPYYLNQFQPRITKQEWIRGNFESMRGSLDRTIGMMIRQTAFYGHSVAEIVADNNVSGYPFQWRLTKLKVLEPERYLFAGQGGEVDRVVYYPVTGAPYPIPAQKLLIIYIPRVDDPEDPYGDCAAARAYPFYLARQIGYKMWAIASKKQAMGHLVGKARSEKQVQLLDRFGKPILDGNGQIKQTTAVFALAEALKRLETGEPIAIDKDADILTVNPGAGENFFREFLGHLQKMILYCYGLPSTILDDTQSGIGNATINTGHRLILDSQIDGLLDIAKSEVIEKIVRPLLITNFGKAAVNNLGEFVSAVNLDPNQQSIRLSNIMQASMQGFVDSTDLEAINTVRQLLGLTAISREEYDLAQLAKWEAEQQQQAG